MLALVATGPAQGRRGRREAGGGGWVVQVNLDLLAGAAGRAVAGADAELQAEDTVVGESERPVDGLGKDLRAADDAVERAGRGWAGDTGTVDGQRRAGDGRAGIHADHALHQRAVGCGGWAVGVGDVARQP